MEEAASPTMAKEESTAESALMQGAPVEEMVQEEEAHVLPATPMPNVAEQAVSEDSPILGVRPADENEISAASTSDVDTLRTYDGSQHAWLDWRNPIFWVRLGLAAVAVVSAVAAIYFVRKIRS